MHCGETVRPSEKLSEGANIGNQGQRVDFLGRHRISTSGFAYMVTETAVFAVRSAKPCFSWDSCSVIRHPYCRLAHASIKQMLHFRDVRACNVMH